MIIPAAQWSCIIKNPTVFLSRWQLETRDGWSFDTNETFRTSAQQSAKAPRPRYPRPRRPSRRHAHPRPARLARGARRAWVILGANGSGKTSLLSALTGYLTPSAGEIELLGETYGNSDWRELGREIHHEPLVRGKIRNVRATAGMRQPAKALNTGANLTRTRHRNKK
ncbi:MAG: ATP-binding cassette domain-containing protein [Chthoniobacteraceae bacterium]